MVRETLTATGTKARTYERWCVNAKRTVLVLGVLAVLIGTVTCPDKYWALVMIIIASLLVISLRGIDQLGRHFHRRHLRRRKSERVISTTSLAEARRQNQIGLVDETIPAPYLDEDLFMVIEQREWVEDYGADPPKILNQRVRTKRRIYLA